MLNTSSKFLYMYIGLSNFLFLMNSDSFKFDCFFFTGGRQYQRLWPRPMWLVVNSPAILACLQYIFPSGIRVGWEGSVYTKVRKNIPQREGNGWRFSIQIPQDYHFKPQGFLDPNRSSHVMYFLSISLAKYTRVKASLKSHWLTIQKWKLRWSLTRQ